MPFKASMAAAATSAPPSADAVSMMEESMAEVYLLAKWQGAETGRHRKYEAAMTTVMDFFQKHAPEALGSASGVDVVAAARATRASGCTPPSEALLRGLQTCVEIRREAANAFADRDTPEKPSAQGAVHTRLANVLSTAQGILSGTADDLGNSSCCDVVSEEELLDTSSSFRAICFMLDLDDLMQMVSSIWTLFKSGDVGLVRATIVTNNCVALARELATTLEKESPHLNNLETIVAEIYMQPAISSLENEHALSHERAVQLASRIHEGLQRNRQTLEAVKDGKAPLTAAREVLASQCAAVVEALGVDAAMASKVMNDVVALNQGSYSEAFAWTRAMKGSNHPLYAARALAKAQVRIEPLPRLL
jgi:hypothetical protein